MTPDGWLCSRSNVKGKVTGLVKYQPQPVVRGDRTRHGALCDTRRRTRPVWTHLKSQMVISAQTWWKLSSYVTVCECHIEIKGYLITYFRHVTYDSPHRTKSIRRWKILGTPVKPKDIRFGWRKLSCAYVLRQWVCCNTQCTKPNRILKGIQAIVNRRQWITIVDSDSVKLSVVHAKAKSSPFGPAQRYLPTDLLLALLCNASSFRRLRFGLCWINLSSVSLGFGCHCSWFRSTSFRFVHIPLAKIGKTLPEFVDDFTGPCFDRLLGFSNYGIFVRTLVHFTKFSVFWGSFGLWSFVCCSCPVWSASFAHTSSWRANIRADRIKVFGDRSRTLRARFGSFNESMK